jgi:hypothetical protein
MSTQQSGEGGSYAYSQSVIAATDAITAAGQFATTFTLPANSLKPGTTGRITFQGVYTTTGTSTPLFNASFQSTPSGGAAGDIVAANGTNTTLSISQTNAGFGGTFHFICISAGSSGTVEAQGMIWSATAAGAVTFLQLANSAVVTMDSTKSQALAIKITPTLVSGQAFTMRTFIVEIF